MRRRIENIKYIGVPFRSGANREGAQYAPKWLMEHLSLPEDVCSFIQFQTEESPLTDSETYGIKNYDAVLRMINAVRTEVVTSLADRKRVVVFGGDHSIAMGSISGALKNYLNLGVIWFDAHTDINTEESSPSSNAHGMPLAALMGLCKSGINNKGGKLKPENVFWVGARDIDAGEGEIIRSRGIEDHVYTYDRVRQMGMSAVMNDIRTILKANSVEYLHLSFDVDGMDPTIVFATGTPVMSGLNERECDEFIKELGTDMPQILSMDFVEYNPLMDDDSYTTGMWCLSVCEKLINMLK